MAMASPTFIVDSTGGISGSLTQLVNGSSYLVAGANITITSQSNGQVLISAAPGGSSTSNTYGNGSDGAVMISSNTTLTRDMYYASLNVNSSISLFSHGYRIFVSGSCVVSGTISNDGGNGSNGGGGDPGPGGTGGPAGTLFGGGIGGGFGATSPGGSPYSVVGMDTVGGNSDSGTNGGTCTPFWNLITLGNTIPDPINGIIYSTAGTGLPITGGPGGGCGEQGSGGGGGGVIALIARSLTVLTGGSIHANGGNNDPNNWGGGGGGGLIIIVTATAYTNDGTIAVNGGTGNTGFGGDGTSGGLYTYLSP